MQEFKVIPKWIVYPEIQLEANPGYDRSKPTIADSYKFSKLFDFDKEDNTLSLGITIKQSEQEDLNLKYSYKVQIYAIFEVQSNFTELDDKLIRQIIADVVHLLIGSLREFIINLTTRGPWGELILPILETKQLNKEIFKSIREKIDAN